MQPALHINKKTVEINWDKISENLLSILWQLVITTIVFYLISHFGKKILNHYLKSKRRPHSKRSRTITALINSIFQYTVIFFYLFGVLSILGIPIGTLLASAGIFSLAIGMGAQGFVSDLVNGFFILSEDQFDVGDVVQINQQIGTVIQLGLRTTRLKGTDGSIIYIPNRNISVVQNLAHGGIALNIDLELDANNNFEEVNNLIKRANSIIQPEKNAIVSGPSITGITKQTGKAVTFSVHFQVNPGKEGSIRNLYLTSYIQILQENNIAFANTTNTNKLTDSKMKKL